MVGQHREWNAPVDGTARGSAGGGTFVSRNPRMRDVLELVAQVADTDATVLICGECGTGKELIAQALHRQSSRCGANFVAVNCGAIPESLYESELFGHVRGAFTGALEQRPGKFESADGGTIFLDEIAEMTGVAQVKLLRILQSGEYSLVGDAAQRRCDVRVVAATNRDLEALIHSGAFRRDLYYRLNIIRLELPPLRERPEDILPLARHFLAMFAAAYGKPVDALSPDVDAALQQYPFPGNIRELENVIRRGVILTGDATLDVRHLPSELTRTRAACLEPGQRIPFHTAKDRAVEEFERSYLTAALVESGGIVSRAARTCGLSERNFHAKLRKYGISGNGFRH